MPRKSKKSADDTALLSRASAVEEAIRSNIEEIITGVEYQIKLRDGEGESQVIYDLPTDFSRDAGLESSQMQIVVWGKVIEYFEQAKEEFAMKIVTREGGSSALVLEWKKSIDPALVRHYKEKVLKYVAKQ